MLDSGIRAYRLDFYAGGPSAMLALTLRLARQWPGLGMAPADLIDRCSALALEHKGKDGNMNIVISHVVALSNNNVIGVDNNLPWNLKTDLIHFKNYTTNKIIVMGRKTYESIGRPLPNRLNFIVSKTIGEIENAFVFKSTKEAIDAAKEKCLGNENYNEIVIIGGGYLFRDTLTITNKLVLTCVDCNIAGDIYYPNIDLSLWKEKSSESFSKNEDNEYNFTVRVYEKF